MQTEPRANGDDNVTPGGKILAMEPECLTDNTFYPVPVHCPAGFFTHTDAKPVPRQGIVTPDKRKTLAMETLACSIHPVKFPVLAQQAFLAQGITGHGTIRPTAACGPWPFSA